MIAPAEIRKSQKRCDNFGCAGSPHLSDCFSGKDLLSRTLWHPYADVH